MVIRYPIVAYIGPQGSGKTLSMVADAYAYHKAGLQVYANFHLNEEYFDYTYLSFEEIVDLLEYLEDAVILIDEAHIGTDAYDFFSKRVREITKFATQIRKRRLRFMYTTQVFIQVAKRLRLQTAYCIYCEELDQAGLIYNACYRADGEELQNEKVRDLSAFFGAYDTEELILLENN